MSVNGPLKGPGGAESPIPGSGTSNGRAPTGDVAQRPVASTRTQAADGPPLRSNSLSPSSGNLPPRAALPQRRASLPSTGAAPWAAHSMFPNGVPQGTGLQHGGIPDPMKSFAQQMDSLAKAAEELSAKSVETANKAADGVKDAVSPPSA